MKCPACHRVLAPVTTAGVTVDACTPGCGGIWFEPGGLVKVSRAPDPTIHALLEVVADPGVHVDLAQRRHCPTCPDSVLMRHFSSATRTVTVDECPTCAGVWLDQGELERIRSEHESGADRSSATRVALEELLIDDRMALAGRQIEQELPWDTVRSKLVSSVLVVFYLFTASRSRSPLNSIWLVTRFCATPMACVWFPEELGSWIGGRITRTSPRSFVWFFGWLVLLLPLIIAAILTAEGVKRSPFTD
jgi:Zn-finger nucleic acid-binding protein